MSDDTTTNAQPALCPACLEAERNPLTGLYQSGCHECEARALAQSMQFHKSAQMRVLDPAYVDALGRVFGSGRAEIERGHARVRRWAERIVRVVDAAKCRDCATEVGN